MVVTGASERFNDRANVIVDIVVSEFREDRESLDGSLDGGDVTDLSIDRRGERSGGTNECWVGREERCEQRGRSI